MDEQLKALLENLNQKINSIDENLKAKPAEDSDENDLDTHIGEPTAQQFKKIKKLTATESNPEDWIVVPYHASNNLIDMDYRKWHKSALVQMGAGFIGRPLLLDHKWGDSDKAVAFIFDAKLVKEEPSKEALNAGGWRKLNNKVVAKEGYEWLYLCAAIPKDSDVADKIVSRAYNDCSTGTILRDSYLICPNCSETHDREVEFYEEDEEGNNICPHYIPSQFMFMLAEMFGMEDEIEFADYAILGAKYQKAVELSSCIQGCLPYASVIRD